MGRVRLMLGRNKTREESLPKGGVTDAADLTNLDNKEELASLTNNCTVLLYHLSTSCHKNQDWLALGSPEPTPPWTDRPSPPFPLPGKTLIVPCCLIRTNCWEQLWCYNRMGSAATRLSTPVPQISVSHHCSTIFCTCVRTRESITFCLLDPFSN